MHEPDSRVQDPQSLDEIDLYAELMIAASARDAPLSAAEIDRVLGVRPEVPPQVRPQLAAQEPAERVRRRTASASRTGR